MPELLLELGCEELPASFVRKAYTDLEARMRQLATDAGLVQEDSSWRSLGTPRRLIVAGRKLKRQQDDQTKEQRGPALKAAYDADGHPTPALMGFCRSNDVDPADLRRDDQYVWASKRIVGRSAAEVLAEIVPQAIRGLTFDKAMRWGSGRMRFARPIRWIVATYDGDPLPFDIEGVVAGLQSRGHRFYAPGPFDAASLDELLAGLRARSVEPDPEARRIAIERQVAHVAEGTPRLDPDLVDENVFLTEWPTAVAGRFRADYLSLPVSVLTTAMAKHEKMFPVQDASGRLTTQFVFVRNSGEDETVRRGNEWVLNARFSDAKFFFDEDAKTSLEGFLEKTSGIVFQEKLGTVRQRADRLSSLAGRLAKWMGADADEAELAQTAGRLCKADLSTGLVSELASLQGVIGGEYARREGLPEPVCEAIAAQYRSPEDLPEGQAGRLALWVLMADHLDKLVGYLGQGLVPSGSSDPYGLRRSAAMLIEGAWRWPRPLPGLEGPARASAELYAGQSVAMPAAWLAPMAELFATRYEAMLEGARHDILSAALLEDDPASVIDPQGVRMRVEALTDLATSNEFVFSSTRPANIVAAAAKKGIACGAGLDQPDAELDSQEGIELRRAAVQARPEIERAVLERDAMALAGALRTLAEPVNRFFDTTMVMVGDERVRAARLSLLAGVARLFRQAGDFAKIVIEG